MQQLQAQTEYTDWCRVVAHPAPNLIVKGHDVTPVQSILPFDMEWKPITGFPDYEVSEYGTIRRLTAGRGNAMVGKIIAPDIFSDYGHLHVKLYVRGGLRKYISVHVAVVLSFIGPKPPDKDEVAHNDGVPWHNHWSNLRWATHAENVSDKKTHGTHLAGDRSPGAILREVQVREIKQKLSQGALQKHLARDFGVHKCTIQAIAAGKNWKGVSC